MTITQTIEIPADHRVSFEFLAPENIPAGKAKVEVKVTPVVEKQDKPMPKSTDEQAKRRAEFLAKLRSQPTPLADSLLGVAANLGDITLEQIRDERLAKHLK